MLKLNNLKVNVPLETIQICHKVFSIIKTNLVFNIWKSMYFVIAFQT